MLLRERDRIKNQKLDQKLKSINLDLQLMNTLANNKQGLGVKEKETATNNIADLAKQLKERNSKFTPNRQTKIKTVDWLAQKGINLKQAYNEMRKNQIVVIDLPPQLKDETIKKEQETSQTQLGFTTNNQLDYIRGYKQLVVYSLMKLSMDNSKNYQKSNALLAKQKTINRLKGLREQKDFQNDKQIFIDPIIQQQSYSDIVKQFAHEYNFSNMNMSDRFCQKFQNKKQFWSIVRNHVNVLSKMESCYEQQKQGINTQSQINTQLMLKSLQMVQRIFDEKLPSNKKQIQILFKKLYNNSNRKINFHYNQKGIPNWGIGYLLYRAGRTKDFYQECLSESKMLKLRQQFVTYDESVANQNPYFSTVGFFSQVSDDFYDQLQYILRGQSKFVSSIVLDYNSLQTVWVILRTMGIYRSLSLINQKDYQQILSSLFLKYQKSSMTKQELHNALYLGAYRNILQLYNNSEKSYESSRNNEVFTRNDFFHLLITVNLNQKLWSNLNLKKDKNTPFIQSKFNQDQFQEQQQLRSLFQNSLKEYLFYLKNIQRDQYFVSYFMLFGPESMIQHSKQLIKTKEDFQRFRWGQFVQILYKRIGQTEGKKFLDRLISEILKNFTPKTYRDYKFIAEKFKTQLEDQQSQVQYLVQLLAKNEYYSQGEIFQDFINMNRFKRGTDSIRDSQYISFLELDKENINRQNIKRGYKRYTFESIQTQIKQIWDYLIKYYKLSQSSSRSSYNFDSHTSDQYQNSPKQKVLKDVFIFLNELRQTTKLIENESCQKLKRQSVKFQVLSNQIQNSLKDVILYLRNKNLFNLYIFYLKERIRAAQVMYQQQCKMTTNVVQNVLKMIQKLQNSPIWELEDCFGHKDTTNNQIKLSYAAQELKNYISSRIQYGPRY